MLISPAKYRNPNNTISVGLATRFTAELHPHLPKILKEQLLARVLLLNANNENFSAEKFYSQFRLNLFIFYSSLLFQSKESQVVVASFIKIERLALHFVRLLHFKCKGRLLFSAIDNLSNR